jgi:hypothetical protein
LLLGKASQLGRLDVGGPQSIHGGANFPHECFHGEVRSEAGLQGEVVYLQKKLGRSSSRKDDIVLRDEQKLGPGRMVACDRVFGQGVDCHQ